MDISIVIPVYNEAEDIGELHRLLKEVLEKLKKAYEIIFVDDGSSDNTTQELRRVIDNDSNVKAIKLRRNFGKALAYSVGFKQAKGDTVFTIDGDLQDDPKEIPNFLRKLEDGYDLVSGWRLKRQDSFWKTISSRLFNNITSLLTGIKIHDMNCGYKIFKREVIENIDIYGELYRFIPVLAAWEGFRTGEIVVSHYPRKHGKSKYGIGKLPKGFFDLLTVLMLTKYAKKPLHFFGGFGLILLSLGFAINLYLSLEKIIFNATIGNRPLLLLGTLLIILGIQLISLGLLGELITKLSFRREQQGVVKNVIKEVIEKGKMSNSI